MTIEELEKSDKLTDFLWNMIKICGINDIDNIDDINYINDEFKQVIEIELKESKNWN